MPYDLPLPRVNTLGSDEGSMTLQELMALCTTLSKKVESLETDLQQTKLTYGVAYTKLIKKGTKIAKIDQDPAISLVQHDAEIQGRHEHDMKFDFDLDVAKDVCTAKPVSTTGAAVTTVKVKWMNLSQYRPRQNCSKNKKDLVIKQLLDYKLNLRKKRGKGLPGLQAEEREMYTEAEQARILVELINQRKRYFAAQKAKERRNKPPTQAQQRTYMSNYIKHMGGYTLQQLRGYSFDEIKNLFETIMRRVHTFVPIESEIEKVIPELAAGSSKRDAEEELDQESSKRQKTGESSEPAEEPKDKEEELSQEELQQMMIIVPEQGMNVEGLQTKYLIIDWEIYTEGIRKDDLVMLWSVVKENFKSTEPTYDKEREIWVELKRLFEPYTDDKLWKLQKHIHDLPWRLYDSCGVHHVSTEKGIDI
ncbi:hypothetical protein Tco_0944993 [Tanacetum coccineum]